MNVLIDYEAWSACSQKWEEILTPLIQRTFFMEKKEGEVSVLLTSDKNITELNKVYRGKDKPTDVLSFPSDLMEEETRYWGDIAIAFETTQKGAQDIPFMEHVMHLTVHGILHLFGYDHILAEEARIMETREAEILANFGIKNPY